MTTQGILYIATGKKYVQAAIRSARTVRKNSPELGIHLFTDAQNFDDFKFEGSPIPFTTVGKIDDPHRRSKVDYISRTPFERTLYLDTDTALNADISNMFRVLERFDIAMAHAQHRNTAGSLGPWRMELPQAFPQYNSGVILYRKTRTVIELLEDWSSNFEESGLRHDQPILRELLWLSELRIATLPPEYNVRFLKYHYLWSKSEAETKIFHLKQLHMGWWHWVFRDPIRMIQKVIRRLGLR